MKKTLILLLLCAFCAPTTLSGRHILGGGMRYYYNPNGLLRVEMIVYIDCNGGGAPFDEPAEIAVYNSQTGTLFSSFGVSLANFEVIAIDSLSCNTLGKCFQLGRYDFQLLLPDNDSSYQVIYQRCCRANDITNLLNPGELGFSMNIEITSYSRILKNNSPSWTGNPKLITCVHTPNVIDLSTSNPDGDLLVYSFCEPLTGGGNIITSPDLYSCIGIKPTPPCPPPYDVVPFNIPNYNFNNPLGSASSQLNPVDGHWNFNPDFIGKFSYAVCIQEYRNGILLSTLRHDLTLWVDGQVGTHETNDLIQISCLPNPAGDIVTLTTDIFEGKTIQIELSDLSGKIWLHEKRMNVTPKELLNVSTLPSGVYLVKVLADGKTAIARCVRL